MNPFRETIVASPWNDARADVTAIHSSVFETCLKGIEHVRTAGNSAAILIHGEAGSGKTHLMSRLRSHLAPKAATATDRAEFLYVWVRLQTSPRMIWRTLRRTLVDDWFRPVNGHRSQFDRILFHRLAEIRVATGDLEPWYEYMLDEDPKGLQELMERIAVKLDLDRNTAVAFEHIAFGRHRRDLRAWLSGTSLPEAALARIDLAQDEGTDEENEDRARQVVLMLCRLAGNSLPIVLSFDQVEALQISPRDFNGHFAFGQMIGTLHDATQNVLLVSCVQSAFYSELRDHIRGADYARLTSLGALSLDPLNRGQAEQLIAARLTATQTSVPENAPQSSCWPLDPYLFSELFTRGDAPLTPRRLLALCAEAYDSWQHREALVASGAISPLPVPATRPAPQEHANVDALPEKMEQFLREQWDAIFATKLADNTPDRTEEIVRHGVSLLAALMMPDFKPVQDELLPDVPVLFEGPSGRVGLSVRIEANMHSAGTKLKHLSQQYETGRLQRLVVIRDNRRLLTKTAKTAQKNLDELQQRGVAVVFASSEIQSALDTLRELLSDAKSGDLDCDGETVPPQTVETWLRTHLDEKLREFMDEIFKGNSTGAVTQ